MTRPTTKELAARTRGAVEDARAAKRAGRSPTDVGAAAATQCKWLAIAFSPPVTMSEFNAGRSAILSFVCELRQARLGFNTALDVANNRSQIDYLRGTFAGLVDVVDAVQESDTQLDTSRVQSDHARLILRARGHARRALLAVTPVSQRAEVIAVLLDIAAGAHVKLRQVESGGGSGTVINVLPAPVTLAHPARAVQTVSRNSAGEMIGSTTAYEGLL